MHSGINRLAARRGRLHELDDVTATLPRAVERLDGVNAHDVLFRTGQRLDAYTFLLSRLFVGVRSRYFIVQLLLGSPFLPLRIHVLPGVLRKSE